MDVVVLSRIQFALTSSFHYIYPPLSIGLGLMLVIFEGIYLKTRNPLYKEITKFWVKIFSLTFALGVATGIVQLFGFGTNWANYSRFVGDVFGSALGAEGIFAFFLEAGFIGLMLFGWDKVGPKMHYFSTIMVALGAHFSAVWITIANSWMQTPTGYKIIGEGVDARAVVTDFWQMIFNPSAMDRLLHVVLGCWLAGVFLVISISAYYYLKKRHLDFAKATMKISLVVGFFTLVLQLISADSTARGVAEHQPPKLAAIEGVYKTRSHVPLTLIGWVDQDSQTVKGIQIPSFLSLLTYRSAEGVITGLDQVPREDWPQVQTVFQTYHAMIWMWGLMMLVALLGLLFWKRGILFKTKWLLRVMVASVFFPQVANQAGWMTAEIGRQPWVVWGLLRTVKGVSTSIDATQVLCSIIMFILIYTLLFALFIYLLNDKISHGPEPVSEEDLYRNPYVSRRST
jgi:cytochrome d ubiquinol oxidase subunit I